jgi:hypothetical protein
MRIAAAVIGIVPAAFLGPFALTYFVLCPAIFG